MPTNDLTRGLNELANSREAYEAADGYYTGKVEEFFANKSIERSLAGAGKTKFRLPFAAKAVDIPIDLIKVTGVTTDAGDAVAEALRTRVWDHNDLDSDILDAFRAAGKYGDYYLTIWPELDEDDDEDETDGEGDVEGQVRSFVEVFMNSPLHMRAIYSRENSRRILFFLKVWESDETDTSGAARWRVNLYYRDRIEQFISKRGAKDRPSKGDDFVAYPEDVVDEEGEDSSIIPNEWGRFPCFHLRQGSKPHGTPLHSRAYGAQDAITKLNTTHLSTVDYIGYPQRYAILDSDAEGEGDDDFIEFETTGSPNVVDPTSKVDVTRKRSKLRSGPGETWWLEGVKSVGQFETAGSEPFIDPIKFQTRAMALLTDLPASEFDLEGGGEVPSGESRRQARAGLRSKVESLISAYRPTVEAMLSLAAEMIGYPGVTVNLAFAPLDAMTGKDDWDTIETKTKNGVPLRQALSEAGYSEEQVLKWYPIEQGAPEPVSLAQATSLFAAIASAGQAVTLGVAGAGDVRGPLGRYLSGVAPELVRPLLDVDDVDLPED